MREELRAQKSLRNTAEKEGKSFDVPWNLMGIAGSLGGFILACALLADDYKDFGDFSTPNHPNPVHHWQIAVPILLGSLAGLGASLLDLLSKTPPPSPRVLEEKLPPSLVEEGLSPNELKKIEEKLGIT